MKALGLTESKALNVLGFIHRTTTRSYIEAPFGYLPMV